MNYLARIQTDPNARRRGLAGVCVRFVKDHRMDSAATVLRLIKRYDAFTANLGENGLVRSNRSQILDHFFGPCRDCQSAHDEAAGRSELQQLKTTQHRGSP